VFSGENRAGSSLKISATALYIEQIAAFCDVSPEIFEELHGCELPRDANFGWIARPSAK
jgi:hypothetical protein